MDYKKLKIGTSATTRNIVSIEKETNSIYESIMIVAKRANQISLDMKEDLHKELEKYSSSTDNLEEVFENREQIDLVRGYEAFPKSTLIALHEYMNDKVHFRRGNSN